MAKFIEKLRALPESRKKIILYAIIGIVGVVLVFLWAKGVLKSFDNLKNADIKINFPSEAGEKISDLKAEIKDAGNKLEETLNASTLPMEEMK